MLNVVTPTIAIIPKLNQTYLTYLLTCSSPQLNTTLLECSALQPLVTGAGENWTLALVTFSLFPILNDYFICIWNNSTSFAPFLVCRWYVYNLSQLHTAPMAPVCLDAVQSTFHDKCLKVGHLKHTLYQCQRADQGNHYI